MPKLVSGDLRQRRFVALAVVLHTHIDEYGAVRQHAGIGGLVAGNDAKLALGEFHDAVAALLGVEGKADADFAAVGLTLRLTLADGRQIDLVARDIERGDIIAGVELHPGGGLVGQLRGGDDVLPAQLERLAAEFAGDLVNETFDREGRPWPRHATIRAHRRLVGGDGVGVELQMANAIGPGQVARRHARFLKCSGRPQRVSAGVDIDVALDAKKRTVALGANGEIISVVTGMGRRQQMLASILDPAHRMSDLQRERGDGNVLRHDPVLAAEAAADVGRDDAHLVFGDAEHPR